VFSQTHKIRLNSVHNLVSPKPNDLMPEFWQSDLVELYRISFGFIHTSGRKHTLVNDRLEPCLRPVWLVIGLDSLCSTQITLLPIELGLRPHFREKFSKVKFGITNTHSSWWVLTNVLKFSFREFRRVGSSHTAH
jgi:hypothetical protein